MTTNGRSRQPIPVACTLSSAAAEAQALEWVDLQQHATSVRPIDHGVCMVFPSSMAVTIDDLAEREASCCAFLTITTARTDGDVVMQITSANDDARPVIAALAGIELS